MSKNWVCQVVFHLSNFLTSTVDCLWKMWHSPVYGFFKVKVEIKYEDNCKYHYFKCAARHCKGKGGVCRYQDSQDHAAMSNLKTHAVRCFGTDAVDAAFKKGPSTTPGTSIFGAFAQLGHQPVSFSHRAHTIDETRVASFPLAHIAQWCAKSNWPMNIVRDHQFKVLMKTGRPGTMIPSPMTVSCNIKIVFERCRERINKILKEHLGHIHFATDAWTSSNHQAFVAWTVHLHHHGHLLAFVLDIIEVPEVR
ncbi:hypothetical protein BC827DRAFT_1137886 [Russula dissimulans]|nr:hypothetical protein BC827DRAFT_1137886 [Russula dissimulans]